MFGGGWSQGEPARVRVPANEVRSRLEVPQSRRLGDRGAIDRKGPARECAGRPARSRWCKSTTMKE